MSFSHSPNQPSIATILELMSAQQEIIQEQQKVNQLTSIRLKELSDSIRAVDDVSKAACNLSNAMSESLTLAQQEIATLRAEVFVMNTVVACLVAKAEPLTKVGLTSILDNPDATLLPTSGEPIGLCEDIRVAARSLRGLIEQ
jgi:hypothetical protein